MSKFSSNLETWWSQRIKQSKKGKTLSPLTIRGLDTPRIALILDKLKGKLKRNLFLPQDREGRRGCF